MKLLKFLLLITGIIAGNINIKATTPDKETEASNTSRLRSNTCHQHDANQEMCSLCGNSVASTSDNKIINLMDFFSCTESHEAKFCLDCVNNIIEESDIFNVKCPVCSANLKLLSKYGHPDRKNWDHYTRSYCPFSYQGKTIPECQTFLADILFLAKYQEFSRKDYCGNSLSDEQVNDIRDDIALLIKKSNPELRESTIAHEVHYWAIMNNKPRIIARLTSWGIDPTKIVIRTNKTHLDLRNLSDKFSHITTIEIENCDKLMKITLGDLPKLGLLMVSHCPNLNIIDLYESNLPQLQTVSLWNCDPFAEKNEQDLLRSLFAQFAPTSRLKYKNTGIERIILPIERLN